jgi:hypothetical protein
VPPKDEITKLINFSRFRPAENKFDIIVSTGSRESRFPCSFNDEVAPKSDLIKTTRLLGNFSND